MKPITPMLLLSANCSISDRNKHLSVEELKNLFMSVGSRELSEVEKYVVEVIQSEAHPQEIKNFQTRYHIPQERIDTLMSYDSYDELDSLNWGAWGSHSWENKKFLINYYQLLSQSKSL